MFKWFILNRILISYSTIVLIDQWFLEQYWIPNLDDMELGFIPINTSVGMDAKERTLQEDQDK